MIRLVAYAFSLFFMCTILHAESVLNSKELFVDTDAIVYRNSRLIINNASANHLVNIHGELRVSGNTMIESAGPRITFGENSDWSLEYGTPLSSPERTFAFIRNVDNVGVITQSVFINSAGNIGVGISNPTTGNWNFFNDRQHLEMGVDARIEWPYQMFSTTDDYAYIGFETTAVDGNHNLIFHIENDNSQETIELRQSGHPAVVRLRVSDSNVSISGSLGSLSDRRDKTAIKPLNNALSTVMKLRPVRYDNRLTPDVSKVNPKLTNRYGFIAQEVLPIVPEVIRKDSQSGYYSVAYANMVALLVEAYKEQDARLEKLLSELDSLEKKSK